MKFKMSIVLLMLCSSMLFGQRPMEFLDRGLVALQLQNGVFMSWRMLGTDAVDISFNLYRNGTKINAQPISTSTNYVDAAGKATDKYAVETIIENSDNSMSEQVSVWPRSAPTAGGAESKPWLARKEIPLPEPPQEVGVEYVPGDMSIGDLDGDGDYELIFEWEGAIPYLEAIDLDGHSLWRIKNGVNTNKNKLAILVYDFDGDGKAEVACKTAPGTVDGLGNYLSKGPAAIDDDAVVLARGYSGSLVEDPAYITVFKGETGEELATTFYYPSIGPQDEMQDNWGDSHGYRASSIKAAVLYNNELGPLMVFTRGIYTRIAMGAFSFDGKKITQEWTFDTKDNPQYKGYEGQGNHSVAVGDVDGDGSDELIYGACAIDHDGKGLYTTGRGHGDSHALADHDPDHPGLEFYQGHENGIYGISMRDAGTGEILWEELSSSDVGRAWAADVDSRYRGSEVVSISTEDKDCKGNVIPTDYNSYFQPVYFDGDVERELRSGASLNGDGRIFTGWYYSAETLHSTKNDANLVADVIGDWREEIIYRRSDNRALIMFSSWFPTNRKNYTLMHDQLYRMNIAVQNIGYNQPAHVGYYFPDGAPIPDIYLNKFDSSKVTPYIPDTTKPDLETIDNQLEPINEECIAFLPDYSKSVKVTDTEYDAFYFSQTPKAGTQIGAIGNSLEVTLFVNDGFGNNSNIETFDVTAVDASAPIITKAFSNHALRAPEGCEKAIPDYTKYVTAIDNCSSDISISMQPSAGTILTGDKDSLVVTITFDDNQGNMVDTSFLVTLNAPLCFPEGLEENNDQLIDVFPNPVVDNVNIRFPWASVDDVKVELYTLSGQIVLDETIASQDVSFDLSSVDSGIYFMKIINGDATIVKYIIKK